MGRSRRVWVGMVLIGIIMAARVGGQDPPKLGCCRVKGTMTCTNATKEECDQIGTNHGEGPSCTVWVEGAHCLPNGVSCSAPGFPPGSLTSGEPAAAQACDCGSCPDLTPPTCALIARRSGPPVEIDIQAQDMGVGLAKIELVLAENASVSIPAFDSATRDPAVVTATKLDPDSPSRVELRILDLSGNSTTCDPVLTQIIRATGKPMSETYANLPAAEDTVTIDNGSPGLSKLEIMMNGQTFLVKGLRDGESRTVDVSSAMLPGKVNICVLKSTGKPGGSAAVLIWSGEQ